jgi:hypothetical protein
MHTYNARPFPVSISATLQKSPRFRSETVSPSPREATTKARAPRPTRRGELRCTTLFPQVDDALGSRVGARGMVLRAKPICRVPGVLDLGPIPHPSVFSAGHRHPRRRLSASSGRESNDLASARNDKGATTTA